MRLSINDRPVAGFQAFGSGQASFGAYHGYLFDTRSTPTSGHVLWLKGEGGVRYGFALTNTITIAPEVSVGADYRRITAEHVNGSTVEEYIPVYVGVSAAYTPSNNQSVFTSLDFLPFQYQHISGGHVSPEPGWRARLTYRHRVLTDWHVDVFGQMASASRSDDGSCRLIMNGVSQEASCYQPKTSSWEVGIGFGRSF